MGRRGTFEADPADGKPGFVKIDTNGFPIEDMADVFTFWKTVHDLGVQASLEAGYVIYPVVEVPWETNEEA